MSGFFGTPVQITHHERRCPRCGCDMRLNDGRERTVPHGIWFEIRCPNCGLEKWLFRAER